VNDTGDDAERGAHARYRGSCNTPLAAYAVIRHGELWLRGLVASRDDAG
jgi:porphobilinogen deaminase